MDAPPTRLRESAAPSAEGCPPSLSRWACCWAAAQARAPKISPSDAGANPRQFPQHVSHIGQGVDSAQGAVTQHGAMMAWRRAPWSDPQNR